MYDTLKFILLEEDLGNKVCFIEEVSCRLTDVKYYNNRVVGRIKNMQVDIRGTTLIVEGSLTKWFLGNNYERFLLLWEIRSAIRSLGSALGVPIEKAKVSRIDIAFNFRVNNLPWLYLTKLLYSDGYHRSNIKKDTLYFDRYDCQLLFYDKIQELCSSKNQEEVATVREIFEGINVLRYEFRFKKVTSIFNGVVRGEQLYNQSFCLLALDKWYHCYMDINKGYDDDFQFFRLDSKKAFELSCVAYCSARLDIYNILEEAFVRRDIDSKNKYDIKDVLRKADELMKDVSNSTSLIDELTKKIDNAYVMLKRRYNVSPARLELLNGSYNNVS